MGSFIEIGCSVIGFLLFASGAILSIGLVVWEVLSMGSATRLPRANRAHFRFTLRHILLLVIVVAILLGCGTWFGWTAKVFVICVASLTTLFWMWFIAKTTWRSTINRNAVGRQRKSEYVFVSLPKRASRRPPKRKRRPAANQQPDYGRYGMWK